MSKLQFVARGVKLDLEVDDQQPSPAKKHVNIQSSHLHALRAGFGLPEPLASVVVLVCDVVEDSLDTMTECMRKTRDTLTDDSEMIIVANAPSNELQAEIAKLENSDQRIVSIQTAQNLGVVAKNLGYMVAQGRYVLSIDGDVIPMKGWVEKFTEYMDATPNCGLIGPCGGRLRVDRWTPEVWPIGQFDDGGETSYFGFEDNRFFGAATETGVDGKWLDVVPSMTWCVRRSMFHEVGYLDWRFGPFVGSDSDFCFRIKQAGHSIHLIRVPVTHKYAGGVSHKLFTDLQDLVKDHIKALYDRWYDKAAAVCGFKG